MIKVDITPLKKPREVDRYFTQACENGGLIGVFLYKKESNIFTIYMIISKFLYIEPLFFLYLTCK